MDQIIISKVEARNFLLYKQGLLGKKIYNGKEGALKFIESVRCLQYDPINVCGKNAEIILHSRVEDFKKEMLEDLLYKDRVLFDYWDKNMSIVLTEDWKYFSFIRKKYQDNGKSLHQVNSVKDRILDKIATDLIVSSKDFDFKVKTDWSWNSTNLGRAALETLYFRGDLIIHHKEGSRKYYGLAERFIPGEILRDDNPITDEWEFFLWRLSRRIKSVGLLWNRASDAWLNIDRCTAANRNQAFMELLDRGRIKEICVEERDNSFFLAAEELPILYDSINASSHSDRMEFIAPLDNLLWDRKLIDYLFGYQYKWEIYTPKDERKYGYYVLPILFNGRLVGRIEMENNKKGHILNVKNIWPEMNADIPKYLLERCIERFAFFNSCDSIKYV